MFFIFFILSGVLFLSFCLWIHSICVIHHLNTFSGTII
ncbi:hypothetical protein G436_3294 [Leptospira interrogans serovar Hardjo str. Norma]|uniref:Uncharacterized protein n=1 Tax=Leptospira interrogans serovar Hardjo str. Norma TaxID=1279460 RepID=A0A0M4NAU5_LEPIR|nr:hypothetical protein G436_3294 [Leptospira interrogans serovar Hardjo str. Norma]